MQKNAPHCSYCRQRCNGQVWLFFGGLGLAVLCFGSFALLLKGYIDYEGALRTIICVVLAALGLLGLYLAFVGLRDRLLPEKSDLAESIRRQLKYPDEAPDVSELFAMVDRDIAESGTWFGNFAIGNEWVLGDKAMRLDRLRGIFYQITAHRNSQGQTHFSYQIFLVDEKGVIQHNYLKTKDALLTAYGALCSRVPLARRGESKKACDAFVNLREEARDAFERKFQKGREEQKQKEGELQQFAQDMILHLPDGTHTSRITSVLLTQTLDDLTEGEFGLMPTQELRGSFGTLLQLSCMRSGDEWLIYCLFRQSSGQHQGWRVLASRSKVLEILNRFTWEKTLPSMEAWEPFELLQGPGREERKPPLSLFTRDKDGFEDTFNQFSRQDVELSAQALCDGENRVVQVACGPLFLWAEAGDASDARCQMRATRIESEELGFYANQCTPRQAKEWLMAFYDHLAALHESTQPYSQWSKDFYSEFSALDLSQWKNETKKVQKEIRKEDKLR